MNPTAASPAPSARILAVLFGLAAIAGLTGAAAAQQPAAKAAAKSGAKAAPATPVAAAAAPAPAPAPTPITRGQYLVKAGGCYACHTAEAKDAVAFAGGRGLKTPFGTFFGPNITPHPTAGIGKWTQEDFNRAMREGRRPDGAHYFPAFPYSSFTLVTDADLGDMFAYLKSLAPNATPSKDHDLRFPFGFRWPMAIWKWLFFKPGTFTADAGKSPQVNRGNYIVSALSHCGECHTPRNFMGGLKRDRLLAGSAKGPEGKAIPNITPTRLKGWSDADLAGFLKDGLTPDGDVTAETMAEVVRNTTSQLTAEDLAAVVAYLRIVPALPVEK